jgi:glycosyltransferase involved in cell wall biosynthesis
MKIIHVVAYYPPHLGGMENTVKVLAERTESLGHKVLVLTSDNTESRQKEKPKKDLRIKYLYSFELFHTPFIPALPIELLKEADRNTIVHLHFAFAYITEISILFSKLKFARIITHIHIDPMESGRMGFLLFFFSRIWKCVLSFSDAIICPTSEYVDLFSSKYDIDRDRCFIIPSGIDPVLYDRKATISKSIQEVLFVGRLSKQKNLPLLLRAFALVNKKAPDMRLNIVGSGEDEKLLIKMISKENINNVLLHGRVSDERLKELYLKSDLFVLPSISESFGIVLIEAMAYGIPIIASDIPGIRNSLCGCGILVNPTPEDFADVILKLKDDTMARQKLVEQYETVLKNYDWNLIMKRLVNVYQKVIEK